MKTRNFLIFHYKNKNLGRKCASYCHESKRRLIVQNTGLKIYIIYLFISFGGEMISKGCIYIALTNITDFKRLVMYEYSGRFWKRHFTPTQGASAAKKIYTYITDRSYQEWLIRNHNQTLASMEKYLNVFHKTQKVFYKWQCKWIQF